jgi:tryptophanyl-tRNA synthetase
LASFKQYREKDGQFYFKLVDAQGGVLLQSRGFASPKVAGQSIALLQQQGAPALTTLAAELEPLDAVRQQAAAAALADLASANA